MARAQSVLWGTGSPRQSVLRKRAPSDRPPSDSCRIEASRSGGLAMNRQVVARASRPPCRTCGRDARATISPHRFIVPMHAENDRAPDVNCNSQTRMTNDEIRRNDEIRMTKPATAQLRVFGHSGIGFLSAFGIRHSSFNDLCRSVAFRRCRSEGTAPYRRIGVSKSTADSHFRLAWGTFGLALLVLSGLGARAFVVDVTDTGEPLRWHLNPPEPP